MVLRNKCTAKYEHAKPRPPNLPVPTNNSKSYFQKNTKIRKTPLQSGEIHNPTTSLNPKPTNSSLTAHRTHRTHEIPPNPPNLLNSPNTTRLTPTHPPPTNAQSFRPPMSRSRMYSASSSLRIRSSAVETNSRMRRYTSSRVKMSSPSFLSMRRISAIVASNYGCS